MIVNMNLVDSFHSQDENNELLKKRFTRVDFVTKEELITHLRGRRKIRSLPNIRELTLPLRFETLAFEKRLSQLRLIKSFHEKKKIRVACQIASRALANTMKMIRPGMKVQEIVDFFRSELLKNGSREYSFLPIVSQNRNNSILHYDRRKNTIQEGAFVLMDVGGKYEHYCSDITRTFPISGSFTDPQKELYEIVLKTLKYAIGLVRPGLRWDALSKKVVKYLYTECLRIGIINTFSHNTFSVMKTLLPHSIGHSVGLDNHDVGDLRVLKENMVIAIEPGIYFTPESKNHPQINQEKLKRYYHLGGVRIEDTILVTKNGSKILSNVPKEIKEITRMLSN
tara:strand:+ start:5250 stop:6266 length:1017 start_codon:yes stop_codon:yes gene_type:complete